MGGRAHGGSGVGWRPASCLSQSAAGQARRDSPVPGWEAALRGSLNTLDRGRAGKEAQRCQEKPGLSSWTADSKHRIEVMWEEGTPVGVPLRA